MNQKEQELQQWAELILARSVRRKMGFGKSYETTNEENTFFREVVKLALESKLNPNAFYFEPMSNKSFSVHYGNYPIGRIKLNGRKTHMQVLKGLSGVKEYHDLMLEEYVLYIPDWIKHIKYCLRN